MHKQCVHALLRATCMPMLYSVSALACTVRLERGCWDIVVLDVGIAFCASRRYVLIPSFHRGICVLLLEKKQACVLTAATQ